MRKVQWLMRQGVLANLEKVKKLHTQASKLISGPMCAACQYAKQHHKATPGTTKKVTPGSHNMLKTNDLFPVSKISVDHSEANPRGHLQHTYRKEKADLRYKEGCITEHHASG